MNINSQDFWQKVMSTINEGVFMVDSEGFICEVNDALCSLTGYEREEMIGKPCSIFECDSCAAMRGSAVYAWCHLFEHKLMTRRRCHIRLRNGDYIPVLKSARLLMATGKAEMSSLSDEQRVFSVETVMDIRELVEKDTYIQRVENLLKPESSFEGLVGTSASMQKVYEMIRHAAQSSAPVLILGESGTGKELVANALHNQSSRRTRPFIGLNCASLNEQVLESELFGHVKGAFTGAGKDRVGRFEAAHTGTLFLDEIGDIPLSMQVKILRVLESGTLERVGDNHPRAVDVRIVSATNRNLPELIEQGLFREDLAFRLNVIPINLPPLRERAEDIALLTTHFIKILREFPGTAVEGVSAELLRLFIMYSWPGNVRQLRNVLEYGAVMARSGLIQTSHMPDYMFNPDSASSAAPAALEPVYSAAPVPVQTAPGFDGATVLNMAVSARQEKQYQEICAALQATGGNVSQAAKLVGVHRTTLINRMLRLGIKIKKSL